MLELRGVNARGFDTIRLVLNRANIENLVFFSERFINPHGCSDGPSFLRIIGWWCCHVFILYALRKDLNKDSSLLRITRVHQLHLSRISNLSNIPTNDHLFDYK